MVYHLSVDCGGSVTKGIYKLPDSQGRYYLMMSPEVEQITAEKLQNYFDYAGWLGSPAPEQQAWLQWDKQVFVVGAMALKFDPADRLRELKYENALYKVAAVIGAIIQRHSLKKNIKIELGVLLPWNEYSDRQRFKEQLEKLLRSYQFRGETIKVQLERFVVRPEGGGLAAAYIMKKGLDWFRSKRLGVLMFGHRNLTALMFENGELKSGESPLIGFSVFLDRLRELTSGLDRDRLASALWKGLAEAGSSTHDVDLELELGCTFHPEWKDLEAIQSLATAKDWSLRQKEIHDIASAIKVATSDYEKKIIRWLNAVFPLPLDEAIVSGGAARFVEPELEDYFHCYYALKPEWRRCLSTHNSKQVYLNERTGEYKAELDAPYFTPIIWDAGISSTISSSLGLDTPQATQLNLAARLVDAFGLLEYMVAKESQGESTTAKQTA